MLEVKMRRDKVKESAQRKVKAVGGNRMTAIGTSVEKENEIENRDGRGINAGLLLSLNKGWESYNIIWREDFFEFSS
jgi:hypothetical protein